MDDTLKKEFISIFLILPTLLYFFQYEELKFLALYVVCFFSIYILKQSGFSFSTLMKKIQWDFCLILFFIFLFSGYFYARFIDENLLFAFPRNNFHLWLFVMFAYPFFSVIPQEIIFRVFFFHRYNIFFKNKKLFSLLINLFIFSYSHIIFQNFHAVLITAIVSPLFAYAYLKKSFMTCVVIHSLGGQIIFTFGLGKYFY